MSPRYTSSLNSRNPEFTAFVAQELAPLLGSGDTILLDGPVGAGKSHFARALIQARLAKNGQVQDVPSPTFTLVQTYEDTDVEIWHCDLYRLISPDEIVELGLDEAFETAICLVEWPDRLGADQPGLALTLRISPEGDSIRRLEFSAEDDRWSPLFARLRSPQPEQVIP